MNLVDPLRASDSLYFTGARCFSSSNQLSVTLICMV
jgi:hypothetical protein